MSVSEVSSFLSTLESMEPTALSLTERSSSVPLSSVSSNLEEMLPGHPPLLWMVVSKLPLITLVVTPTVKWSPVGSLDCDDEQFLFLLVGSLVRGRLFCPEPKTLEHYSRRSKGKQVPSGLPLSATRGRARWYRNTALHWLHFTRDD